MSGKRVLFVWLCIFIVASTGIFIGRWSVAGVSAEGEGYEELRTFTEVMSMVKKYYVEEVKPKDLVNGAIKGMLNSLDPHSSFMTPEAYKEMQVDTKGEFGGLGIQIGVKDSTLTVIAPIEDTPAYKAGIKAGDKIIKINNESTKDMNMQDAVSKMRGAPKTSVTLSIFREGWKDTKDFTIVRDIIKIKSVKSKTLENNIGYIKLSQFQEQTADDLIVAVKQLNDSKATSLILDLRNNPGGLLNSAIDVAGQFLPRGKLVVYTKTKSGEKSEFNTGGDNIFTLPMIVLVNQGSASASEIVAGALKDWNRAVILGNQTFGKGSVQTVIPLSGGAGLRLTTAKYYTPKGTSIQNTGITPDIIVKIAAKNGVKEHRVLREKDLQGHLKNEQKDSLPDDEETAPLEVDEKDDIQLQRAIDILKTWDVLKALPKAA
ncbi:MAG: peptidase S41 [Nitrospira bacterium HGW-Nitrospira-1]|nr:MAG: peptidase S41 [Nitrospira bacterium HGW-Nitrospira-1]